MKIYQQYLINCINCGSSTSRKYAREHSGLCKFCSTGKSDKPNKTILCPDCNEHYLTPYQKAHHYHCDYCTKQTDPEGYRMEVMGYND